MDNILLLDTSIATDNIGDEIIMECTRKELVPMQPGDVPVTYADTTPLEQDFGFKPNTSLREGLRRFAEWYARYYNN